MDHGTIELVCIAVIAFAVLLQTIILLAVFVGMGKTAKLIKEELEVLRSSVLPALKNTSEVLARVSPKLESTITDVSELARMMRKQATEAEVSVEQLLETVRKQTGRIDGMMTSALDAIDNDADDEDSHRQIQEESRFHQQGHRTNEQEAEQVNAVFQNQITANL